MNSISSLVLFFFRQKSLNYEMSPPSRLSFVRLFCRSSTQFPKFFGLPPPVPVSYPTSPPEGTPPLSIGLVLCLYVTRSSRRHSCLPCRSSFRSLSLLSTSDTLLRTVYRLRVICPLPIRRCIVDDTRSEPRFTTFRGSSRLGGRRDTRPMVPSLSVLLNGVRGVHPRSQPWIHTHQNQDFGDTHMSG